MALAQLEHADTGMLDERRSRLTPRLPADGWLGWAAPIFIALFALALRLHRLSIPSGIVFDETYYAKDSNDLLRYGHERSDDGSIADFVAHPPFGKWLIAAGEWLQHTGFLNQPESWGWRISAAVFGALSVLVLCRLGRRMFRSTFLGCLAGGLMALDGLHFVQSRISMLDIFLLFWVVAATACVVADRDDMRQRLADRLGGDLSYPGPRLGFRWWRLAAGLCLGAAIATKWSGIYYVAALGLLSFAWDVGARRTAGVPAPFRATLWRETVPFATLLLVVPVAFYVASWAGWFLTDGGFARDQGAYGGFVEYHRQMWHFHTTLKQSTHPHTYMSGPWEWLILARPVSYWYTSPVPFSSMEILGIGTPAVWWAAIGGLLATTWRWVSRRDWRASLVLVCVAVAILPWFAAPERTMFLFYALPALPFLCLALALSAGMLMERVERLGAARGWAAGALAGYLGLVVLNFFYFYPILAAKVIPTSSWQSRIWFSSWI